MAGAPRWGSWTSSRTWASRRRRSHSHGPRTAWGLACRVHRTALAGTKRRPRSWPRRPGALENGLTRHRAARSRAPGNGTARNRASLRSGAGGRGFRTGRRCGRLVHRSGAGLRHNHAPRRSCRRGRARGWRRRSSRSGLGGRLFRQRSRCSRGRSHLCRRNRHSWARGRHNHGLRRRSGRLRCSRRRRRSGRRHHWLRGSGRRLSRSGGSRRGLAFHRGRRGGRRRGRTPHWWRGNSLLLLRDQLQHIPGFGDVRQINLGLDSVRIFAARTLGFGRTRPLRFGLGLKMGPHPHRFVCLN